MFSSDCDDDGLAIATSTIIIIVIVTIISSSSSGVMLKRRRENIALADVAVQLSSTEFFVCRSADVCLH